MYIPEFWAGVGATIFIEVILFLAWVYWFNTHDDGGRE